MTNGNEIIVPRTIWNVFVGDLSDCQLCVCPNGLNFANYRFSAKYLHSTRNFHQFVGFEFSVRFDFTGFKSLKVRPPVNWRNKTLQNIKERLILNCLVSSCAVAFDSKLARVLAHGMRDREICFSFANHCLSSSFKFLSIGHCDYK